VLVEEEEGLLGDRVEVGRLLHGRTPAGEGGERLGDAADPLRVSLEDGQVLANRRRQAGRIRVLEHELDA
jgi:hypothetical protein